jgi:serine/threonine protein kinase
MRRRVAVKILPTRRAGDPGALERFHREARAAACLHHPNIVAAYDTDQDGELHFLVMEYVDGSSLDRIVRIRGPLDPPRAAHYIRQAALGLQHAHESGLIHRDIKPANLLVDRTGTVKVLDMGLALFFREEADDLTRNQPPGPMGTADYMAPEQARDSHRVDVRADIYSLGATLYFLIQGRSPGKAAVVRKSLGSPGQPPQPLREARTNAPEELLRIIDRMLANDPGQRYQSAAEVAEALVPWAATAVPPPAEEEMPQLSRAAMGNGSPADSPSPPTPPSATASTVVHFTGPGPKTPQPRAAKVTSRPPSKATGPANGPDRRRVLAWTTAVLLSAGVLGWLAYLAVIKDGKPDATTQPGEPPGTRPETAGRLGILVPAYFFPGDNGLQQWDRLVESAGGPELVAILNPKSGPGEEAIPGYTQILKRAKAVGITVIGYVSTRHAQRPLRAVKADVDRWAQFYPLLDGIFFDEQATGADQVPYYASLYEKVRRVLGHGLVVTNPGAPCAEEYLSRPATDLGCLAEVSKNFDEYRPPPWADRYPTQRFGALIRGVGSLEQMKKYVRQMPGKKVGYCYITDAKGPNPWDRLPSYWEAEVAAVRRVNKGQAP